MSPRCQPNNFRLSIYGIVNDESQSKGVVCAIVPISGSDVRHFLKLGHSVNRLDSRDIPGHK